VWEVAQGGPLILEHFERVRSDGSGSCYHSAAPKRRTWYPEAIAGKVVRMSQAGEKMRKVVNVDLNNVLIDGHVRLCFASFDGDKDAHGVPKR
jgi:hypothetical protein